MAATTEFGQIVVNGLFTFALMVGMSVADTPWYADRNLVMTR